MPVFFFPTTSDGILREDPVGTEHPDQAAALHEGYAHVQEMVIERLKYGHGNFEELVEIRDAQGTVLGRKQITITSLEPD